MFDAPPVELHAVALAVYHESRNQPKHCQMLVASVVINRMKSRKMSALQVVSQKGQFTWYGKRRVVNEWGAYKQSLVVAKKVLNGPPISRYQYFHLGKHGGIRCGDQVFSVHFTGNEK